MYLVAALVEVVVVVVEVGAVVVDVVVVDVVVVKTEYIRLELDSEPDCYPNSNPIEVEKLELCSRRSGPYWWYTLVN
jgi:hypothetical protein